MSATRIALLYVLFAIIATVINLGVQRLILVWSTNTVGFGLALFCGTLAGLVVKYVLDKRWIFADYSTGLKAHGQKFTLYTIMGLVTTAIFWGAEIVFWLIWRTDGMRELGAILGLSVGYTAKYFLDRSFVFVDRPKVASS